MRSKLCIGRDDDDAAAAWRVTTRRRRVEQAADGNAVDAQLVVGAEVCQRQDADDCIADTPAGSTDAALPAEADRPGPGADGALCDLATCRVERTPDIGRLHLHRARVVQPAVVALADNWNDEVLGSDRGICIDGRGHRA